MLQNSSDESFLLDDGTAVVRILKPPTLPGASTKALPGRWVYGTLGSDLGSGKYPMIARWEGGLH